MGQPTIRLEEVAIAAGGSDLGASMAEPDQARGVVLFAHGSGSSRYSPRNRFVATTLQRAQLATVLLDLLSCEEAGEETRATQRHLAIPLLSDRLVAAIDWLAGHPSLAHLPLGLFGASTGAAVALTAAARRSTTVRAVICRGGRPDLAPGALPLVRAPVLLIVGERDPLVLQCNERAARQLRSLHQLVVVPGATHLFEEPGTLQAVADLSSAWFRRHLARRQN